VGRDCVVRLQGQWWAVDPIAGDFASYPPLGWSLPSGGWVGLAAIDDDHLALASADQRLHVLDIRSGTIDAVIPSRVPPSRRWHYGECVPLAATPEWLATLDHHRNLLTFAGMRGEPGSTVRLDGL